MRLHWLIISIVLVALIFWANHGVGICAACFLGAWLMPWQPLGTRPQPILIRKNDRARRGR